MTPKLFHSLRLEDLRLAVHLGCTPEERAVVQEVRIAVELRFLVAPFGTESDELSDTVCYAEISDKITRHCESREFKLIERMGFECYHLVRELTDREVGVAVTVHKVKPPVNNLRGGAHYRCGDFA